MQALIEVEKKLAAKQKALAGIMAEAGPDVDMSKVTSLDGDSNAKVAAIRALGAEADELGGERDGLRAVKALAESVAAAEDRGEDDGIDGPQGDQTKGRKSFGDAFVDSEAFKSVQGGNGPAVDLDFELKTLLETSAGFAPETTRTGRVVDFATRPIQVVDFIPQVPTSQSAVVYMEETTLTNAAAEAAEGAAYAEAALAYNEKSSPVRKIAVFIPVTDEQLEDVGGMAARINNRLPFMVRQRLDLQILSGNGTAPSLEGIGERAGIQTQAKGADKVPDAVYKAMTKVRVGAFSMPNLIVMNPTDWSKIRLLTTSDGVYLWGSPADVGPERMWGTQVVQAHAQASGTGLVLDTSQLELSVRRGINVQVSNSHSDYFIKGKQAVRADIRAALQVYRPASICEVTGI